MAKDLAKTEPASEPLDELETIRLDVLERVVERNLDGFYNVGKALEEIRDKRLYRATHSDFGIYLNERWEMSRTRGYQWIETAKVADQLGGALGEQPKEAHVRAVAPLVKEKPEVVQETIDSVKATGKVTAKKLADDANLKLGKKAVSAGVDKSAASAIADKGEQLVLDFEGDERQKWQARADECGYTLTEYIRALVEADLAKEEKR